MPINLYCTTGEVRDQGFRNPPYTDTQVERAIRIASTTIENTTGQWFGVKDRTIAVDAPGWGPGGPQLPVPIPIVQIDTVELVFDVQGVTTYQVIDLTNIKVYNRHLTMGLTNPDDRRAPRLELQTVLGGDFFLGNWSSGPQNVRLTGKFGWTELDPDDAVGETSNGSQVPLSYGVVPEDIRDACIRLVKRNLPYLSNDAGIASVTRAHEEIEVETRDQRVKYAGASGSTGGESGYGGVTGDPIVDRVLEGYMRPTHMVMV